ncbi:hypothetical protein BDR22DRAFT_843892 [Usnea florida]
MGDDNVLVRGYLSLVAGYLCSDKHDCPNHRHLPGPSRYVPYYRIPLGSEGGLTGRFCYASGSSLRCG